MLPIDTPDGGELLSEEIGSLSADGIVELPEVGSIFIFLAVSKLRLEGSVIPTSAKFLLAVSFSTKILLSSKYRYLGIEDSTAATGPPDEILDADFGS